ncbi:HAD family hydrolase [Kumtagia ephedrae]|uniref:HAD family hydrolase n=1 Tax=Kumtagia ephedrae TaxID=2116701 RepID=A0A2P7SJ40_9HYPH|nr:HAD-IA family hydrolase [Mesorhizobium ephedrae]PSJ62490.1 HAD family hydrolase [Mesorhizobium ephedrae]
MNQPDLVIFDFDGTLVDSEIIAARVEADLLTRAGFPITGEEMCVRYAGLTFKDIMLRIEEEAHVPLQASLIGEAEVLVDRKLRAEVRMIDGARAAVAAVGAKRCICSNSRTERIRFMLEKTGLDHLFGADDVFSALSTPSGRPKPAPDVFLHAAKHYAADPANTFVVEDSVHGIHGAKAAGMRVIGFTGAAHTYPGHADMLTDAGAETVIHRWSDFRGVLAALAEWSDA